MILIAGGWRACLRIGRTVPPEPGVCLAVGGQVPGEASPTAAAGGIGVPGMASSPRVNRVAGAAGCRDRMSQAVSRVGGVLPSRPSPGRAQRVIKELADHNLPTAAVDEKVREFLLRPSVALPCLPRRRSLSRRQ